MLEFIINPFDHLVEDPREKKSRFLKSSFKTKCFDAFHVFFGADNYIENDNLNGRVVREFRLGLFDYFALGIPTYFVYKGNELYERMRSFNQRNTPQRLQVAREFFHVMEIFSIILRFVFSALLTMVSLPFISISHLGSKMFSETIKQDVKLNVLVDENNEELKETLGGFLLRNNLYLEDIFIKQDDENLVIYRREDPQAPGPKGQVLLKQALCKVSFDDNINMDALNQLSIFHTEKLSTETSCDHSPENLDVAPHN